MDNKKAERNRARVRASEEEKIKAAYTKDWMAKTVEEVNAKRLEDVKLIPADEARYIADTSSLVLKRISRFIRSQSAEEGSTLLRYCIENISDSLLNFIVDELKKAGYEVGFEDNMQVLVISW